MGTTIILCVTLLLICVAVCVTVLLVRMNDNDTERMEGEIRKLKSEIFKLRKDGDA